MKNEEVVERMILTRPIDRTNAFVQRVETKLVPDNIRSVRFKLEKSGTRTLMAEKEQTSPLRRKDVCNS